MFATEITSYGMNKSWIRWDQINPLTVSYLLKNKKVWHRIKGIDWIVSDYFMGVAHN